MLTIQVLAWLIKCIVLTLTEILANSIADSSYNDNEIGDRDKSNVDFLAVIKIR